MMNSFYEEDYNFNKNYLIWRNNKTPINLLKFISYNLSYKNILDNKRNLGIIQMVIKIINSMNAKVTFARKSIATFKLRKDMALGSKIHLHNKFAINQLYILKKTVFPNVNDFNLITKKNFDDNYNFNMGIKDIVIYPEINNSFEYFDKNIGMNFTWVFPLKINNNPKLIVSLWEYPYIK